MLTYPAILEQTNESSRTQVTYYLISGTQVTQHVKLETCLNAISASSFTGVNDIACQNSWIASVLLYTNKFSRNLLDLT
jgi:hypothetical protein